MSDPGVASALPREDLCLRLGPSPAAPPSPQLTGWFQIVCRASGRFWRAPTDSSWSCVYSYPEHGLGCERVNNSSKQPSFLPPRARPGFAGSSSPGRGVFPPCLTLWGRQDRVHPLCASPVGSVKSSFRVLGESRECAGVELLLVELTRTDGSSGDATLCRLSVRAGTQTPGAHLQHVLGNSNIKGVPPAMARLRDGKGFLRCCGVLVVLAFLNGWGWFGGLRVGAH